MAVVQNALWRRDEQVRRWNLSETNTEPTSPTEKRNPTVKFQDSYVFLAACSSCDREEIERLLKKGADINTANIDGLTALHQACIDDNLSMVQFLINQGADIDACDNEGWTALHATASCGFLEIAKYLVEKGASIAAVNNDGELASDLAEGDDMECFLAEEMETQGIDADAARNEEENIMLRDANQWLSGKYEDVPHQKTGATALHVAASKGYLKVITILLQAGADINAVDFDGWTPLHAAAHWGQDEVCKLLVDNNCDMNIRNNSGQTALDLADTDVVPLLEELKKSQVPLKENFLSNSLNDISSEHKSQSTKRRSSVTRMSGDQKQHIVSKSVEDERSKLQELRKVEEEKEDMKKEEVKKPLKEGSGSDAENDEEMDDDDDEAGSSESDSEKQVEKQDENKRKSQDKDQTMSSGLTKRPLSSSTAMLGPTDNQIGSLAGLRKTGSSSAVPDHKEDVDKLARSASSSWIEKKDTTDDKNKPRRIMSYSGVGDNSTESGKVKFNDFYARYTSLLNKTTSITPTIQASPVTTPSGSLSSSNGDPKPAISEREQKHHTQVTSPSRTNFSTIGTTTTTGSGGRRTYEPPKRDEEKEVERKARAKRARETRRSTQGVTKEDIAKAEEALKLANQGDELRGSTDKYRYQKKEYNHDSSTDDKSDKENKPENFTSQTPSQQLTYKIDSKSENDDTSNQVNDRRSRDIKDTLSLSTDSSYLRKEDPSQKSTAIKARRKRESRRPTGKITLEDIQGVPSESKESSEEKEEKLEPMHKPEPLLRQDPLLKQCSKQTTSRYSEPVTSTLQNLTDNGRHSYPARTRTSGFGSSDKGTIDFNKLYEQEKAENEKLRKEIDTLKQELTETQLTLERTKQKTEAKSNDSREKRALERKVAKLEEEVKSIDSLKSDNIRLKEENGALIRVISKLSK